MPLGLEAPDPRSPPPTVSVPEDAYDFGFMDSNATGQHEFILTNTGRGPLRIEQGSTSCKCTATVLEEGEIPPGESGSVVVEWTAKGFSGDFEQTATILTNDPENPRVTLTVQGRITVAVRAVPSQLRFNGLAADESQSASVRLFGYRPEPLEITGYEFGDEGTSEYFELTYRPLSSDELSEEPGATSGVLVDVTVKPGLPIGAFRQEILLKTKSQEAPTVKVPVQGTVTGEVLVIGKGWSEDRGVLYWGSIGHEGAERTLLIRARHGDSQEVSYEPVEIYPDLLQVTLGEASHLEGGKVTVTPLTIRVPEGSPAANHMGPKEEQFGRIVLETNSPEVPQLRILVRFAVQG
jgi:hypothetical protein